MAKSSSSTPLDMYFSRGFLLPGLMGILFLLLTGGLLAGLKGLIAAFLIAVLYAAVVVTLRVLYVRKRNRKAGSETLAPVMGRIMFDAVVKMKAPVFICDSEERIIWYNTATEALFLSENRSSLENKLYGKTVSELFGVGLAQIRDDKSEEGAVLSCEGRTFTARYSDIKSDENNFALVMTTETTETERLQRLMSDTELVVMYIFVDNLTEMMQYDSENYRMTAARADQSLREWAEE